MLASVIRRVHLMLNWRPLLIQAVLFFPADMYTILPFLTLKLVFLIYLHLNRKQVKQFRKIIFLLIFLPF